MKTGVHIGEKIKQRVYELRMPVSEFAQKINRSRTVAYHIFSRKSIDAELLKKIGEALEYDFFKHYTKHTTKEEYATGKLNDPDESRDYYNILKKNYESRIESLNKEINYLKEINEMLKERLKKQK